MGGLIKHIFWVAPLGVVLLLATWFLTRESHVEMRVQDAEFNRDWNEAMVVFSKDKKESQRYKNRALSAQSRYSSALIEQSEKSDEMRQHEGSINSAVMELDKELAGKAARGGAK